ncbi:MAG: 16S rRNA (guanine(527)-N(7))-methyltransferase RsmG [Clostridia bacterium]|nr:16S rRNA (guanine(527)-N(7))-methyltransferase RsmG [Clostridia bacterium]
MKKIFNEFSYQLSDVELKKFELYYNLLTFYNEKFNLTAITEKREVVIKHFIDSIINVDKLIGKTLIDIGSGGGFPAIPIKIMREDIDLTMLEATEKKCGFLREVVSELDLKNVKVICGRAEEFANKPEFREKFDLCTSRAVARLNILSEYCLPFVKRGGTLVAYKGDAEEEIKEALSGINILGGKIENTENYLLDGAKRCLIYIKKDRKTELKYPRANGQIRKKPL